jgi:L-seryl-tRNA(Ser) seleniumtransferase
MGREDILKQIPQVEKILAAALLDPLLQDLPRSRLLKASRLVLDELRTRILGGQLLTVPPLAAIGELVKNKALSLNAPQLRPVINATGVILHTNLGRAPLAPLALERALLTSQSYCSLEYDPATGQRADRLKPVVDLLTELTGAEDALAVNNNAAALFLLMVTLAHGRRAIISRGELVEIGGSFRLADIIEAAGVKLWEVGSTNQTRLVDYQKALDADAGENQIAAILKVHAANFRQTGYAGQVDIEVLAPLAQARQIPLIVDLGSGTLVDLAKVGLIEETPVKKALQLGADVVCFSGDKLLGGPQAGIIVGRESLVSQLRRHPLARTVRLDKMALAALEATALLAQDPLEAQKSLPVWRMLHLTDQELRRKAGLLKKNLGTAPNLKLSIVRVESQAGGGSAPEIGLASWAVAIESGAHNVALLEERLRAQKIPVIARVNRDRLLLDVRTIAPTEFSELKRAFQKAWSELTEEPATAAPLPANL